MDYPSQHTLAGLVTTLSLGALSVSRLFLVNNVQEDAMWLYQIGFSAFHISISIRTASLALLSVVVYIIIKHGLSRVKLAPLIASVVILWVVVVLSAYLTSHQLTNMSHFAMVSWSVTLLSPHIDIKGIHTHGVLYTE